MFKRNPSLVACVLFGALVASGQSSYLFQLSGANGTSTQITGVGDNDFSRPLSNANGTAGAFQVVATPKGDKFFIVSPTGVQSAPATLSPLTALAVSGAVTSAAVTPDGKYLLVLGDHFYIINASTNALVQTDLGVLSNGGIPVGFAVSRDSQTVWVLSNGSSGGALAAVNLTSLQTTSQPTNLSGLIGTSVTLSPLGKLYVTSTSQTLLEIDPSTLAVTAAGQINIPGLAGPLRFTPDGSTGYAVNVPAAGAQSVCASCFSLFALNVATHSVSSWPTAPDGTQPTFADVFAAGNGQAYAFSPTSPTVKLWDVTSAPSAAPSALGDPNGVARLPTSNVIAVAMSNERPAARFLYLLISNGDLLRVNIAASNLDQRSSVALQNGTALSFAPIPAQTGAASLFALNKTQTVQPGATSGLLIAQVVDSVGRPVYNLPVCFSTDPSNGLNITQPSQITNADGWVQTTVVAPTTASPYTVTLSAGVACPSPGNLLSTTFTVNVGTSGNGSSQMSIFTGNGQLLGQQVSTFLQPLTVKLTNPDGTPAVGAVVTWAITHGPGHLSPVDSASDSNGLFRENFVTELVDQSHAFQATTINASSNFGSVDFIETTQNAAPEDPLGIPTTTPPLGPDGNDVKQPLTIPQGSVLANAFTSRTISGHPPQAGAPIPNIGLRMADVPDTGPSVVAVCQGSSLGGDDGFSHCNLNAFCQPAGTVLPQTFAMYVIVGEYHGYRLDVTVTPGQASLLSIVSGNNQTGNPTNSFTLVAKVTDGCGQGAGGVTVNWAVTQGSASLTQVQTVSSGNGAISARVTLGATAGPVQVTVSGANLTPVVFNFTTQIAVSGISIVSGGGQSAAVGQAFPNPVVFVVRDTNNNPVPNQLVNFSVTGKASISPLSATTNSQGQVQTSVTAGATPDTIQVTATTGNVFATAVLSSHVAGPQLTSTSFVNAASLAVGMTPCGLVTVSGNGIAPTVQGVVSGVNAFGPLPYTLAGLSITANNIPVPIEVVANLNGVQQANFQAPCELTVGTANVVVTVNGTSTPVANVPVLAVQPGVFTYAGPNGKLYGAVIRAVDGSYVTPSNQAHQGERLYMVATGLGQGTPTIVTNSAGTGSQNVNLPIVVGVHDNGVPVLSARYLVGSIGAYLVEFQLPPDAPTGTDQSLALAAAVNGSLVFGNPVFLPGVVAGP